METLLVDNPEEIRGINSRSELAEVSRHVRQTKNEALMAAVRQSSINPARALGLPCAGLVPGAAADLVVLGSDLTVTGVLRQGSWDIEPGARKD